jgi:NAD(P)-dependent dehydrogenase (short-subunit alcohol dehydrogenase family)
MRGRNIVFAALGSATALAAFALVSPRRKYSFQDKVVLITGGSRGLGLVLARRFAALGAKVAICARDASELERAIDDLQERSAKVFADVCDIRNSGNVKRLVDEVCSHFGPIDVLVNCAGVIQVGPLATQTQEDFENAMAVHFWGPFYLMQEVIPSMRQRGKGRIVNISSIGGKVAMPHLAAYCASKFALAGLSSAMRVELGKDNVWVTSVYPGLMRTGSHINAKFKGQNIKEFALFSLSDATPLTSIDVERAADQIVSACSRGDAEIVITLQAKLATKIQALAPETISSLLSWANRFLPEEGGVGTGSATGAESGSQISPSTLTKLIDQASVENNELEPGELVRS